MAIKFQYNKTYLQILQRDLKVRVNALPTLAAKESALRLEVKKARTHLGEIKARQKENDGELAKTHRMWAEFPQGVISIRDVKLELRKVAGVKTPTFKNVEFEIKPYSLFGEPGWVPTGLELLKKAAAVGVERSVAEKTVDILEYARKKTTQKVNLYEKVQIPAYEEAILKIKRFLEDEENLAKSSQKILKGKIAAEEAAA